MIKRTTHYFLLTMLVLTGLAGRMHLSTLSAKDRRLLLDELKSSRAALLESVSGLTEKQAAYKVDGVSIRQYTDRLARLEDEMRTKFEQAMSNERSSAHTDCSAETDALMEKEERLGSLPALTHSSFQGALRCYKKGSAALIVFARTTTDPVKGHFAAGFGPDAFHTLCLTGKYTRFYASKIKALRGSPGFPLK